MPKFNRSLSTIKLVRETFYITFLHDFEWQSGHYFVTGATGQINMSLRNTIHYMETRGFSGYIPNIKALEHVISDKKCCISYQTLLFQIKKNKRFTNIDIEKLDTPPGGHIFKTFK